MNMDLFNFEMHYAKTFFKRLLVEIEELEDISVKELIEDGLSDEKIRELIDFILTGKRLINNPDKYRVSVNIFDNYNEDVDIDDIDDIHVDNEDVDIDDLEGEYDL